MRILVTGGAGFIASHVTEGFIAAGHEVAVLDNLITGFRKNIPPEAKFFEGDIRDIEFVRSVFDEFKPEAVDHHAAQMDVRKSLDDPIFDAHTNILGSINLIQNAVRVKVKKFIYISTGGAVYGEPQWLPVMENHEIRPECAYGISKHTVEHYLELYRLLEGLPYTVLRYPNVFGPRQNPHGEAGVNAIFIGLMLAGKQPVIYGDGEQLRDYTYVSDIVNANCLALERGEGEIVNIGSGIGTSVNTIYECLADIIHFPRPADYQPARKGEIEKIFLDARKAKAVLGWEPKVSFREGLEKTVEWSKQQLLRQA
ncbi:NAD-dependent epimerase/dehydratase family protein [bacterium]|nr:NAD-dependent epimerase/dehydratase family protein [bacterium]MBU1920761.1 NAD-dependent epimerase/dehydratase family protein [bacterium]RQV97449.1 MAG: NAD-dependent epimerase/dehydratase family protein [bacterium]